MPATHTSKKGQATGGITPRAGVDFLRLLPCCCCCCCRLRFSVTLCKCVLANPVKIAFGTCQHCVASQKSQNPKTKNTQKKKEKPQTPLQPPPTQPLPPPLVTLCPSFFATFCSAIFITRYVFALFRLVSCNSRTFISLVIHFHSYLHASIGKLFLGFVWDSVLGFSDFSLCCCFYFSRSLFDAAFFFM